MRTTILSFILIMISMPSMATGDRPSFSIANMHKPMSAELRDMIILDAPTVKTNLPVCKKMHGGLFIGYKKSDCYIDNNRSMLIYYSNPVSWVILNNIIEKSKDECWLNGSPTVCDKAVKEWEYACDKKQSNYDCVFKKQP